MRFSSTTSDVYDLQQCRIFGRMGEAGRSCLHQISLCDLLAGRLDEENRCRHISFQQHRGQLAQEWLQVYLFNQILTPLTPRLQNSRLFIPHTSFLFIRGVACAHVSVHA